MRCPRCKKLHDVLAYTPLEQIEEFADETNAIVKCPNCRWFFSPGSTADELMRAFEPPVVEELHVLAEEPTLMEASNV